MDNLQTRVEVLEEQAAQVASWQQHIDRELTSAQNQRKKLFAEVGKVRDEISGIGKEVTSVKDVVQNHFQINEEHRKVVHEKLDAILNTLTDHEKTDSEHDAKISKTAKELAKAEKELEVIKQQAKQAFREEVKAKAAPVALGLGGLGYFVAMLFENLPHIVQMISLFMKGS